MNCNFRNFRGQRHTNLPNCPFVFLKTKSINYKVSDTFPCKESCDLVTPVISVISVIRAIRVIRANMLLLTFDNVNNRELEFSTALHCSSVFCGQGKTSKTLEGRSATFRIQGLSCFFLFRRSGAQNLFFWPQLLHDFL